MLKVAEASETRSFRWALLPMTSYFLASGTFLANLGDSLIVLDRRNDEYVFLDRDISQAVLGALSDPPLPLGTRNIQAAAALKEMEAKGIVTTDRTVGKPVEFLSMYPDSIEVPGCRIDAIPRIRLRHILAMMSAAARAFFMLRIRGLETAIRDISKIDVLSTVAISPNHISNLVEIHNRIKPILFSNKDQCMMNSLVMIYFLAGYGIRPRWCFGVKLEPFKAHCWVEDHQFLYNDQFCHTHEFTPIMRV